MNVMKNKLLILSPIIALVVIIIFSLTLVPSVSLTPKDLPIAIVNEDQGPMGQTIVDNVQKASGTATAGTESPVKWSVVTSYDEAMTALNNQEYYAALVIPKDFSAKQATFRTPTPASPEVQILVNQGMSAMASNMASQILNGVVDNMNNMVRTQLFDAIQKQGDTLNTKQAASLVSPIAKKVTNVNEIGTSSASGNAPVSMFQPLWMASIAGAAISFLAISKAGAVTRKEKFVTRIVQIVIGAVIALFAGFGLTSMAELIGLNVPQFADMALFLTIASFSFFLMISAVLSLLGLRGIPIFVIILFFGAPLLAMPRELMSAFYRDWVYSWLPMRFLVEGLRELFFFGQGLTWNHPTAVLVWIGVVSLVVILLSALKPAASAAASPSAKAAQ